MEKYGRFTYQNGREMTRRVHADRLANLLDNLTLAQVLVAISGISHDSDCCYPQMIC
jgi:hypothetical protein